MIYNILVTTQMMIHDQPRFREWIEGLGFHVDFIMNDQFMLEPNCLEIPPIYDGWISGDDEITESVLAHLSPKLRVISKWGTGIDSIDLSAARRLGVHVKNSVGAFQNAVGELAVGYALALSRGIFDTHRDVMEGRWPKRQYREMSELCVGLIGFGAIGRGVADRLRPFGCNIIYHDPFCKDSELESFSIEALASTADLFIVTASLNESTDGLLGHEFFKRIKRGSFLVNVSRGQLVNEVELMRSLENGQLAGAALDVYHKEPLSSTSMLRRHPNVILGSHNANNTFKTVEYVHQNTIDQLIEALRA